MSSISLRSRRRRRAWTMRCAFSASTLSWNSRSKPLVTAEHDDQRRDAQHDAHRRHRREDGEHAQQERHHRDQPAGQDADDAGGLDDAAPVLRRARKNSDEADDDQRQPAHEADRYAHARAPPAVQVAEADQALQIEFEQLDQHPAEADRDGDRQQRPARPVGQPRPGREARRSPRAPRSPAPRWPAGRSCVTTRRAARRHDWARQASSFLDTLRRQTVPYTAMAFPRARRLPPPTSAPSGLRALAGAGARARGQERSPPAESLPAQMPSTQSSAAGSSATPTAAS